MPEKDKSVRLSDKVKDVFLEDKFGKKSEMIFIPKFKWSDVMEDGPDRTCSAFIVGGKEIEGFYVSKYQNHVEDGCAYSEEGHDPVGLLTIDEARLACKNKGKGWHLMTNSEWMAVAYWCQKCQSSISEDDHFEWLPEGFGLTARLWEFAAGLRLKNGEIQVIPDNDSALNVDESRDSVLWKAVDSNGFLVVPKSKGTLYLDGTQEGNDRTEINEIAGGVVLSYSVEYMQHTAGDVDKDYACSCIYQDELKPRAGVHVPEFLKEIGIGVNGNGSKKHILYVRNFGERIAIRGGNQDAYEHAGPFAMFMSHPRTIRSSTNGFRAAYIIR